MTIDERRNEYRLYASQTLQNENTINNYIRSLDEDFSQKLNIDTIFNIIDLSSLRDISNRCNNDLEEWSRSTGNHLPRAAINKYIKFIESQQIDDEFANKTNIQSLNTKNIMLYGAPGVGKTHNYKKLISMIENGVKEQDIFKSISTNDNTTDEYNDIFQNIKDEKRIEFVTFHQSYSYEDFIEGFRPSEEGNIELENGIFKEISTNANNNLTDSKLKGLRNISLAELLSKFTNHIQEHLDDEKKFFINKTITIKSINNKGAFLLGGSVKSPQRLALDIIERDYEQFKQGLIKTYEDVKPKFESQRSFHGNARYYFMFYKKMYEYELNIDKSYINLESTEQKNFYIVIDEINRGNISKIFGELITLIEEDKRDDYEITLPYSKEKFKIPSNLFIIGTMNSTDKSIATIDIALRRRFTFLKMKPNEELINFYNAKVLMKNLNEFIGENIGEDYKLGHSYFMKVVNDEELEFVKEYKIKPLLEEYFYADEDNYKKVTQLLNEDLYE
ncbi:McrB family protein [Arcobacter peruensis]|uniref:McrB family protein n=1 Tax=Arcobacter peruensis TaxID=2320140 RepID=UPI000F07C989|nr:AAA family ATPase [Arcobacter peruensis]